MMTVIFEVWPAAGRRDEYLDLAAALRTEVTKIDGLISVERFESLYEQGKLLSLQFWRDEESIARWRNHLEHRRVQRMGRGGVFAKYRLRVAQIVRDYGRDDRAEAQADSVALT
jgi:heme-degrading monooxygenase HmoA